MIMDMRHLKLGLAVASFATAVALSFTSLLISEDNDIAANVLFVVAQFLTLCATILGIDYKFTPSISQSHDKQITSGTQK